MKPASSYFWLFELLYPLKKAKNCCEMWNRNKACPTTPPMISGHRSYPKVVLALVSLPSWFRAQLNRWLQYVFWTAQWLGSDIGCRRECVQVRQYHEERLTVCGINWFMISFFVSKDSWSVVKLCTSISAKLINTSFCCENWHNVDKNIHNAMRTMIITNQ